MGNTTCTGEKSQPQSVIEIIHDYSSSDSACEEEMKVDSENIDDYDMNENNQQDSRNQTPYGLKQEEIDHKVEDWFMYNREFLLLKHLDYTLDIHSLRSECNVINENEEEKSHHGSTTTVSEIDKKPEPEDHDLAAVPVSPGDDVGNKVEEPTASSDFVSPNDKPELAPDKAEQHLETERTEKTIIPEPEVLEKHSKSLEHRSSGEDASNRPNENDVVDEDGYTNSLKETEDDSMIKTTTESIAKTPVRQTASDVPPKKSYRRKPHNVRLPPKPTGITSDRPAEIGPGCEDGLYNYHFYTYIMPSDVDDMLSGFKSENTTDKRLAKLERETNCKIRLLCLEAGRFLKGLPRRKVTITGPSYMSITRAMIGIEELFPAIIKNASFVKPIPEFMTYQYPSHTNEFVVRNYGKNLYIHSTRGSNVDKKWADKILPHRIIPPVIPRNTNANNVCAKCISLRASRTIS